MKSRPNSATTKVLLGIGLAVALCVDALAKEELVTLQTRPGVEQRFLLLKPDRPVASVILFAGGKGTLQLSNSAFGASMQWGKSNFLVRTRTDFAKQGFAVATVDAPSDRQGRQGMIGGFRVSGDHVTDIDAVISWLRKHTDVPVWLVGTSRGTESAAYIAVNSKQNPDGLVLTSSITVSDDKGTAVTAMGLGRVRIPTLIVAHENDECVYTPPAGAEAIRAALANSSRVEVAYFTGGRQRSDPCKARSYHGFLGVEEKVVDRISRFINAN